MSRVIESRLFKSRFIERRCLESLFFQSRIIKKERKVMLLESQLTMRPRLLEKVVNGALREPGLKYIF